MVAGGALTAYLFIIGLTMFVFPVASIVVDSWITQGPLLWLLGK